MTNREAKEMARLLGMSAWKRRVADRHGHPARRVKCVGFASANFVVGWGESWEEALEMAADVAFST